MNFTTINHEIRQNLGLSWIEYGLADSIYHLGNNPENPTKGWCYASKKYLADFLNVSEATVFRAIKVLLEKGLIEKDLETNYLKATKVWYKGYVKMTDTMSNCDTDYVKMRAEGYVKMTDNIDNTDNNNNINNPPLSPLTGKSYSKLIFEELYKINPAISFNQKRYWDSADWLVEKLGGEKALEACKAAVMAYGKPFAPVITNPTQLKEKLSQLRVFYTNNKTKNTHAIL